MENSAPRLAFVPCPPAFQQLQPLRLSRARRPSTPFPVMPPMPKRPQPFRLGITARLGRVWRAATSLPPAPRFGAALRVNW